MSFGKDFLEVELAASGAGRAEEDQMVPVVPGVRRPEGCVGVPVRYGTSAGSRDQHEGAEDGVGAHPSDADSTPPGYFAQRISDTAAFCFDSLLQQGIRQMTFVKVVHLHGAWHDANDRILKAANASFRPTKTEYGVIAKFTGCAMAVVVESLSGDPPEFLFSVDCMLYDACGMPKPEVQAVANYSKVSALTRSRSMKHSTLCCRCWCLCLSEDLSNTLGF